MTAAELLRDDLRLLASLVPEGARVLDVGCGDGALLEYLRDTRSCEVRGIELSLDGVTCCVARGVPVIQADLEDGMRDLPNDSFDIVVVSQTLQEIRNLRPLLAEVMRVGRRAVISYPNFGHYSARFRLGMRGRMPVSKTLPYTWFDTPNVHYTTISDFHVLCTALGLVLQQESWYRLAPGGLRAVHLLPNLRAELAVAVVSR